MLTGDHEIGATSAENRKAHPDGEVAGSIHDDSVAADYGFRGAVVHGIRVLEAALAPVYREWGTDWFSGGGISLRHRRPVYAGEPLVARFSPAERAGAFDLVVLDPAGEQVAVGEVTGPDAGRIAPEVPPAAEPPSPKRRAEKGSIAVGDPVVGVPVPVDETLLHEQLFEDPALRRAGLALPAASLVVHVAGAAGFDTFEWQTPGMYYSSENTFFAPPRFGSTLRSTGVVVETFERNGNTFFTTDYTVADEHQVIAVSRLTVLYHMGTRS